VALTKVIEAMMDKCPNLNWVHCIWAGVENLCKSPRFVEQKQILLTNNRGGSALPLAEYVIAALLFFAKQIKHFETMKDKCQWVTGFGDQLFNLNQRQITIVGYGKTGSAIAKIAKQGFGMKIIAVKRNIKGDWDKSNVDHAFTMDDVYKSLKGSRFVINCLPFTPETKDFVDKKFFYSMDKGSVYMNVGRGMTNIEDDLREALKDHLMGAALDVARKEPMPSDHWVY